MASSSSMPKTYDVFVSFRGADIRNKFLSHLQRAFDREKIIAFVDEHLERGAEITSSLLAKIEDSNISVVIFSENYAFSPWCLDELVKILECMQKKEQTVIPVFYDVDPTDVQELRGKFGAAISQHRNDCLEKVETWSHALKEIANVSGLVSQPTKPDSKLIDEIICQLPRMYRHCNSDNYEGLVGIDHRIRHVNSLLSSLSSSKVKIVGIWGMGGIGKSTLAKKVYDRIKGQFTFRCFVEKVSERFGNGNSNSVQKEIFCAIFGKAIANRADSTMLLPDIVQGLRRKKVCIILDDVNDIAQIENSIGKYDNFRDGSVVIITSRDKQLLAFAKAEVYEVELLNGNDALHLFCLHAFDQSTPKQDYATLSGRAVDYADGNPLALKVLGSNLFERSVKEWEDGLEKLKDMPNDKINNILRISYDMLDRRDKEIFVYTACFFIVEDKDHVVRMLGMAGSEAGLRNLHDKSLISINETDLYMHDLLQEMGKDITCEENELEKRKILWRHEDIRDLFTNDMGTGAIKGISLDMSEIRNIELKPTAFERLRNLRYLKFHNSSCPEGEGKNKVYVLGGLDHFPSELRLLQWDGYPLKSLPSNFFLENLVELRIRFSELEELWSGAQQLGNLKWIDLSGSRMLSRLPDFSNAPNVEALNLTFCDNIQSLPENLGDLKSLQYLWLSNTAIKELPQSICNMQRLKCLWLSRRNCSMPNNLGKLRSLKAIDASGIKGGMIEFPNSSCSVVSLQKLHIAGNDFESIPETIKQLSDLNLLILKDCKRLQYLPELPLLNDLNLNGCTSLKSVFGSSQLLHKQKKLVVLQLGNCLNLKNEEYHQIIDYAISSYPYQNKEFMLLIPGSEVPQKIKYKNTSGSSLSFSFSYNQLEVLRGFCFCLFFKPKYDSYLVIGCEATFKDESEYIFHDLDSDCLFQSYELNPTEATHLALWNESCDIPISEGGISGSYNVKFDFYNGDGCDSIIGCGIHPIFEENNDDRTEEEDEEKVPVKKLKHS